MSVLCNEESTEISVCDSPEVRIGAFLVPDELSMQMAGHKLIGQDYKDSVIIIFVKS